MWSKTVRAPRSLCQHASASISSASATPSCRLCAPTQHRRQFHDYFVTHLPSSSQHPDSKRAGPHHRLPRDQSTPHDPSELQRPAATSPVGVARDLTVLRIPLRSAKHHFGAHSSRGQRPYNEDAFQAGTIELPAFARRRPRSVSAKDWEKQKEALAAQREAESAKDTVTGDPQVFYFGVFDGHGGSECSEFLRDRLHTYLEDSARQFRLESSLTKTSYASSVVDPDDQVPPEETREGTTQEELDHQVVQLQREVIRSWKNLVGGYFRRFKPEYFSTRGGGNEQSLTPKELKGSELVEIANWKPLKAPVNIETVLEWAFLKTDLDFIAAQVAKDDGSKLESAINDSEVLDSPAKLRDSIGGPKRFIGGSTCSIALISTPTATPFWHPQATSTIFACHCGDTRILLCDTGSGSAIPLTSTHHPNDPHEAQRLRRYAATFVTDSFGEERVAGLANTRAFGDMQSKRIGVSAEPELTRIEVAAGQFSFMVMVSDGVTNTLSDQEMVDIVKEARTPEQGAKDLISFATEVTADGDNATALVVRLGGWERRNEGGGGSLRTKEDREFKRKEAVDPRSRRM